MKRLEIQPQAPSMFGPRTGTKAPFRDRLTIAWRTLRYGYVLSRIEVTFESRTETWAPVWIYLTKYNK